MLLVRPFLVDEPSPLPFSSFRPRFAFVAIPISSVRYSIARPSRLDQQEKWTVVPQRVSLEFASWKKTVIFVVGIGYYLCGTEESQWIF